MGVRIERYSRRSVSSTENFAIAAATNSILCDPCFPQFRMSFTISVPLFILSSCWRDWYQVLCTLCIFLREYAP